MRSTVALLVAAILLTTTAGAAKADRGVVALRVSGCDYYLLSGNNGFVVAEWYGGYDPARGDIVVGKFDTYGMVTLFFGGAAAESTSYIDDYWLNQEDVIEKISEHCH